MLNLINSQNFESTIDDILDEYKDDVQDVLQDEAKKAGRKAVQKLKATSPKRETGGDYAKSWTAKTTVKGRSISVVVHNKEHYRLTHLLENGHVIKNGKGTYGRTRKFSHIEPVEVQVSKEYMSNVERRLNNV